LVIALASLSLLIKIGHNWIIPEYPQSRQKYELGSVLELYQKSIKL